MTAARVVLVACSVVIVAYALQRGGDVRSCDDARGAAFALAATKAPTPADGGRALAADVVAACRGSDGLVAASQALSAIGALDGAGRLAETAIDRDPQAFQAHNALATVLAARGNPQDAERERAQARTLNPLAPPPSAPRLGPDGRPLSG